MYSKYLLITDSNGGLSYNFFIKSINCSEIHFDLNVTFFIYVIAIGYQGQTNPVTTSLKGVGFGIENVYYLANSLM